MEDERAEILQSLARHPGWGLVVAEIDRRLRMDFAALKTEETLENVRKLQGRIAELEALRDWPLQESRRLSK